MSSAVCDHEVIAVLAVRSPAKGRISLSIREGERLFVGSDESSDICLPDQGVALTHCELSAEGGAVSVRDCYSEIGTQVDGSRIRETTLNRNAEIRVGEAVIGVSFSNKQQTVSSAVMSAPTTDVSAVENSSSTQVDTDVDVQSNEATAATAGIEHELRAELELARAEIEVLNDRLARSSPSPVAAAETDPWQDEMIELLRAEVIELQNQLAERELQQPTSSQPTDSSADDVLAQEDAERLVERLEQLLAELQLRDEQISTLTGLLESAEDAARAERSERDQMNSWLQDIEKRFGSREQEWSLQREQFEQTIAGLVREREQAEQVINADSSSAKLEASQKLLTDLREVAETQRVQLQESEKTILQLRGELEQASSSQLREEQLQLAADRAELARQRQELETLRQQEQRAGQNEATLKLQALRQHLNEIHVHEQKEKEERKLSSRIARLWNRLDGRS